MIGRDSIWEEERGETVTSSHDRESRSSFLWTVLGLPIHLVLDGDFRVTVRGCDRDVFLRTATDPAPLAHPAAKA